MNVSISRCCVVLVIRVLPQVKDYDYNGFYGMTLLQALLEAEALMKRKTSEVRKTIKNCAGEVPESNSKLLATAMCNAGLKT